MTVENRICGWLYKFQNTFLKSRKGIRISFFKSKSFHSVTGYQKKEFIRKLCLALKRGILSLVLVLYASARKHSEWILQRLTVKYFDFVQVIVQISCRRIHIINYRKSEVSSATSVTFGVKSSERSLIQIRNRNDPSIDL